MSSWWLGLPPAQAILTCGEDSHRLRWEAGALTAIDHDDLEAESALAALGGQRCTCVEVVEAWRRHEGDPRVLVLASRGPSDPIAASVDWTTQLAARPPALMAAPASPAGAARRGLLRLPMRRRPQAPAPRSPGHGPVPFVPAASTPLRTTSESELVALLALGGGLQDRLVATVAAAWTQRLDDPDTTGNGAVPALHASMHGRLVAVLRSWLGRADLELDLHLVDAGREPSMREVGGVIEAELPFRWLAEVWSRGLATVIGRFCLAARTEDGRAWTLTTVGPDLGPPAPVRVELPAA